MALDENPRRKRIKIQLQSTNVDAANTGGLFVDFGTQPEITVGAISQGEVLVAGDSIEEPQAGGTIDPKYKKQVWIRSDKADMSVTVEEDVEAAA